MLVVQVGGVLVSVSHGRVTVQVGMPAACRRDLPCLVCVIVVTVVVRMTMFVDQLGMIMHVAVRFPEHQ